MYWFIVRWGVLLLKRKNQVLTRGGGVTQVDEARSKKENIDENIKHTTGKVFDELFKADKKKPAAAAPVVA